MTLQAEQVQFSDEFIKGKLTGHEAGEESDKQIQNININKVQRKHWKH